MNIRLILSIILTVNLAFAHSSFADHVDDALRYADKRQWDSAYKAATLYKDPVLRKIILSKQYLDTSYKGNSFESVKAFIESNPNWPVINSLKEAAEKYINYSTKHQELASWFAHNHLKTSNGHKFYALSISDPAKHPKIVKDGWIYGNFSPEEARKFLAKNKNIITQADHLRKIDYLLWTCDKLAAQNIASMLGSNEKKVYNIYLAIFDGKVNKSDLFNRLPIEYRYNSGVLYKYLEQFKKADQIPVSAAELILHAPHDPMYHKDWWKLKNLFARNMIQQKKYSLAHKIASNHHGSCHRDKSDSEWLAGWIELEFLHNPKSAYEHFKKMHEVVKNPISLARGSYWMARAAEAMKNKELEHQWLREAAAFNFTFYGQIAMLEMKKENLTLPPMPKITSEDKAFYAKNELARATNLFIKHNRLDQALLYAKSAISHAKNSGEAALIVSSIKGSSNKHYTLEIAKAAAQKGFLMVHDNYPTPYKIPKTKIDPALTYSIIAKESMFNQHAVSHANCHGLMQVLPATGCKLAKKLKQKCCVKRLTSDPMHNITLGNKYLEELLTRYGGSYLLTAAAYNAGPEPVDRWLEKEKIGDPRKLKTMRQVIHWIESMPYYETRDYVQRILENVQVYRYIIHESSVLELRRDLLRGANGRHK